MYIHSIYIIYICIHIHTAGGCTVVYSIMTCWIGRWLALNFKRGPSKVLYGGDSGELLVSSITFYSKFNNGFLLAAFDL